MERHCSLPSLPPESPLVTGVFWRKRSPLVTACHRVFWVEKRNKMAKLVTGMSSFGQRKGPKWPIAGDVTACQGGLFNCRGCHRCHRLSPISFGWNKGTKWSIVGDAGDVADVTACHRGLSGGTKWSFGAPRLPAELVTVSAFYRLSYGGFGAPQQPLSPPSVDELQGRVLFFGFGPLKADTTASALLLKHEFLDATLGEVLLEPTLTTLGNFLVRSNSQSSARPASRWAALSWRAFAWKIA